jgi:hypothetical protein
VDFLHQFHDHVVPKEDMAPFSPAPACRTSVHNSGNGGQAGAIAAQKNPATMIRSG